MLLSAQSKDGKDHDGMLNSLVATKRCKRAWDQSQCQQEEHWNAAEGKVIADYDPHIDYARSEPKNQPDAQEEKERTMQVLDGQDYQKGTISPVS